MFSFLTFLVVPRPMHKVLQVVTSGISDVRRAHTVTLELTVLGHLTR